MKMRRNIKRNRILHYSGGDSVGLLWTVLDMVYYGSYTNYTVTVVSFEDIKGCLCTSTAVWSDSSAVPNQIVADYSATPLKSRSVSIGSSIL